MVNYFKHIVWHFVEKFKFRGKCIFDFSTTIYPYAKFEGANRIYPNCHFKGSLGYGSYVGSNCVLYANVGRFTSIAQFVRVNLGTHPYTLPFVSTSPMFFSTAKQNGSTFAKEMIFDEVKPLPLIGNDCWIGENVFIIGGITIGDGAIVLAGAVVTSDVPPYAIVGGIPAKIIRYRYDNATISLLLKTKWWEKDISWLSEHWRLLCDMEQYKSHFEHEDGD